MDKDANPEGHQDEEQADRELSIAEIQEICEHQVLAMSGGPGAGASSIPRCPACGRERHSREDCWVLHPHKAPEWRQDKLKSKKIGKGSQAKPPAQGGGKGKGPHKGGTFQPCEGCRSTLHPPGDCWTLHPELREKAKAEGGLVSDTTEKVAGNAANPRRLTGLVGIWAPHRHLYAPLCGPQFMNQ